MVGSSGFPRSKERGLIEANGELLRAPYVTLFPRSKERGLIEAVFPWSDADALAPFRVRKNAASLKPSIDLGLRRRVADFPRSKERGLIEADCGRCQGRWSRAFRVRKNAASLKLTTAFQVFTRNLAFRVRKNAASLKLRLGCPYRSVESRFPRSKERGLIEAQPEWVGPPGEPLLSAFERTRPH